MFGSASYIFPPHFGGCSHSLSLASKYPHAMHSKGLSGSYSSYERSQMYRLHSISVASKAKNVTNTRKHQDFIKGLFFVSTQRNKYYLTLEV